MRGINMVILLGNLGKDPEVRYTGSGVCIANISLATTEVYKDESKTEWHRVVFFGKLAEIAAEYLKKGSTAYIQGKNQTRKWKDKAGNDRYTTEIVADKLEMIGGNPASAQSQNKRTASGPAPTPSDNNFVDDDIPF